jgi:hypothetical protein
MWIGHRPSKRRPFRPSILEEVDNDRLRQHVLANCPEVPGLVKITLAVVMVAFTVGLIGSLT